MPSKKGFTVIEALIGTLILAVSLISSTAFYYANRRNTSFANFERLATWSAVDQIERLKGGPYSLVQSGTDSVDLFGTPAQRVTTVTPVNENGVQFQQVTVQVTWSNGSITLTTYIAQK